MATQSRRKRIHGRIALATALLSAPLGAVARAGGVVVEEVTEGSVADKAGIRAGDVIVSWRREASPPANPSSAQGAVDSPFDLALVEIEQAPRGRCRQKRLRFPAPAGLA